MSVNRMIVFIVIVITFAIITASRRIRCSYGMLLSAWVVLGFHYLVAVTNAYFFTTIGADADAKTFHRIGMELAQNGDFSFGIGSRGYKQFLGIVYYIFGPSHLLGQSLSILAFVLSCIVLLKLMRFLGVQRHQGAVLMFFGALPTMVLLGSVTLRESYQVLFFMLAVYYAVKFHMRKSYASVFGVLMAALAMGFFHKGLMLYAVFLVISVTMWRIRPARGLWTISKSRLIALALLLIGLGSVLVFPMIVSGIPGIETMAAIIQGRGLEYVTHYRESSALSRATYGIMLDTSSWVSLALTSIQMFFYYLFVPFPWQVSNLMDLYAAMESWLRLVLIIFSIKTWRAARGEQQRLYGLLLILYFSMAFLWAMGTTNYGTAIRHHMVNYWLIVLMGVPPLMAFVDRLRRGLTMVTDSGYHYPQEIGVLR